jgi:hypothetical protein
MLLQLFGCGYNAFSEITVEELNNYDGSIIKIKTSEDEFTIEEESGKYKTYWEAGDSSIIIVKKEIFSFLEIPVDTTHISYNAIEKIKIEKWESFTTLETAVLVTGSVLVAAAFIYLFSLVIEDAFSWD